MNCKFRYTETFFKSFDMVLDHLLFYGEQDSSVIEKAERALTKVKKVLLEYPEAYPINQDLLAYGLSYREANTEDGFRILYTITQTSEACWVDFELFLQKKMSCQKALQEFCLLL